MPELFEVNGKRYQIPDHLKAKFLASFPNAQSMGQGKGTYFSRENKLYNIPENLTQKFLSQFPDAQKLDISPELMGPRRAELDQIIPDPYVQPPDLATPATKQPEKAGMIQDDVLSPTPQLKEQEERSFWENIEESYSRGIKGAEVDHLMFESMLGIKDYDEVKKIKNEYEKKLQTDPVEAQNWISGIVHATAQMAGPMVEGIAQGAVTGVGAAIAGPGGAAVGFKLGAAQYWFRQGAGAVYAELKEDGVDDDIAKTVGAIAGVPYAAIEFSQLKILGNLAKPIIVKTARKVATELAKRHGSTWAKEVTEEMLQEGVQIAAEETGIAINNELKGTDIEQAGFWEMVERIWETGKQAAGPMWLLTMLGLPVGAVRAKVEKPKVTEEKKEEIKKEAAEIAPSITKEEIAKEAAEISPKLKVSPKVEKPEISEKPVEVKDAQTFKQEIKEKFELSDEESEAVTEITEARAQKWAETTNRPKEEWYSTHIAEVKKGEEVTGERYFSQMAEEGEIPEFTIENKTEDAINFGLKAKGKPQLIKDLEQKAEEFKKKFKEQFNNHDLNAAMESSYLAQLYREAVEVATGKGGAAEYAKKEMLYQEAEPMFYSKMQRTLEEKMPNRTNPAQIRRILNEAGILKEEVELSGLEDWLKAHDKVLSKDFVLDFIKSNKSDVEKLFQKQKGAVEFLADGRAIVHAFEGADVTTVVHELAHVFRRDLNDKDMQTVLQWTDQKTWNKEAEEKFARGFEKYLHTGKAPTAKLKAVFEKFRKWIQEIYGRIKGSAIDVNVTPKVKDVFDRLLGGEVKETKPIKKAAPKTVRQWLVQRGRVKPEDLAEHGISQKEERGIKLQVGAAKGKGLGLDDLAATAIEEGIIPQLPTDTNPTDWLIKHIRDNAKILEEVGVEEKLEDDRVEYLYEEARNEGAIPTEMDLEEFKIQIGEADVLFQEEEVKPEYEKEFIAEKAKQGIDIQKLKTLAQKYADREKIKEKGKEGQLDVFVEAEKKKQQQLFQSTPSEAMEFAISLEKGNWLTRFVKNTINAMKELPAYFGTRRTQYGYWVDDPELGKEIYDIKRRGDVDKNIHTREIDKDTNMIFLGVKKKYRKRISEVLLGIQGRDVDTNEIVFGALQRSDNVYGDLKEGTVLDDGRIVGPQIAKYTHQTYRLHSKRDTERKYNELIKEFPRAKELMDDWIDPIETVRTTERGLRMPPFSKKVMKEVYKIDSSMEEEEGIAYLPSMPKESKYFRTWSKVSQNFRTMPWFMKKYSKHRMYQTGKLRESGKEERDFKEITKKIRTDLAVEEIHNKMVAQLLSLTLKPLNNNNPLKEGWVAFNLGFFREENVKNKMLSMLEKMKPLIEAHGIDHTDLMSSIHQAAGSNYQVSEKLLDDLTVEYKQEKGSLLKAVDQIFGSFIRGVTAYWLIRISTVVRNVFSNLDFISVGNIRNFWEDSFNLILEPGRAAPYAKTISGLLAAIPMELNPAKRFRPKKAISKEMLGASFLTDYQRAESPYSIKGLFFKFWNATEYSAKRLIYWTEFRAAAIRDYTLIKMGKKPLHKLTDEQMKLAENKEKEKFIDDYFFNVPDVVESAAYEQMDFWMFNYDDIPSRLEKMKKSSIVKGLLPYPVFFYKLIRQQAELFNPLNLVKLAKAQRKGDKKGMAKYMANIMTAATISSILYYILADDEDEDDDRVEGENVPYYVDTFGRVEIFPGTWVRIYDIPYIGEAMFLQGMIKRGKPAYEYFVERIALGPIWEFGLISMGYGDKYDFTYSGELKPAGGRYGRWAAGVMPYTNILKYLRTVYDPVKRISYNEYKGFIANLWLGFASQMPIISKMVAPKIDRDGKPIEFRPEIEFAKFFMLNVKNPDLEDYNRAIISLTQRLKRLKYKAISAGDKEELMKGFDYGSEEIWEEWEDINKLIDTLEKIESKLIRLKSKVTKRRKE